VSCEGQTKGCVSFIKSTALHPGSSLQLTELTNNLNQFIRKMLGTLSSVQLEASTGPFNFQLLSAKASGIVWHKCLPVHKPTSLSAPGSSASREFVYSLHFEYFPFRCQLNANTVYMTVHELFTPCFGIIMSLSARVAQSVKRCVALTSHPHLAQRLNKE
jgi:hypothetical protein